MTRIAAYLAATAGLTAILAACDTSNRLADLGPPPKQVPRATENLTQAEIGNRLVAGGELELALKAYRFSMVEEGANHDALVGMGVANLGLGRLNQARRVLERAAEQFPDSQVAWNNLGVAAYKLRDYALARNAFSNAYALSGGTDAETIALNLALADLALERDGPPPAARTPEYLVVPHGLGRYELVRQKKKDT